MRKVIWLLILLAALWGGWWAVATTQMQSAVSSLLDARRTAGWEVALDGTAKAGFPLTLENRLDGLALADPSKRVTLQSSELTLSAPAWWPGDLSIKTPLLRLEAPAGALPVKVTATDLDARLSLHPGLALELKELAAQTAGLRLDGPDGMLLEVGQARAEMRQTSDRARTYDLYFLPKAITPGPFLHRLFAQDDTPAAAPQVVARAQMTFDRPLDRQAGLRGNEPRVEEINLTETRITWGEITLMAEGALAIDAQGQPDGALSLRVTNWARLVDIAQRAGLLPPPMRLQVETMLGALENRGDTPGGLNLELVFAEGQMTLADIPLGPAPLLAPLLLR